MNKKSIRNIKKSILFILIIVIIILLLNLVYLKEVLPKKLDYRKYLLFTKSFDNDSQKYIFFGDSHTRAGINPEFIPLSYNMGYGGSSHINSYYQLNKSLFYKSKVKIIILELDLHIFTEGRNKLQTRSSSLLIDSKYMPFKKLKEVYGLSTIQLWLSLNIPVIGNGEEFRMLRSTALSKINKGGWKKREGNLTSLSEEKKSLISKYKYPAHFKDKKIIGNESFEHLVKIINLANQNNITVIFLKYPISNYYDLHVINANNISKEEFYTNLSFMLNKTFNQTFITLDYYNLFDNNQDYFNDLDHLNYIGAEILSRRIYEDFKKLNLTD